MRATDIKKGGLYAAVSYGKPTTGTHVFQCRVEKEIETRKGKQAEFFVRRTAHIDRDWKVHKDERDRTLYLKSIQFYMPWEEYEEVIAEQRQQRKEYEERREKKEQEQKEQRDERRALVRKLAEVSGVEIIPLDGLDSEGYHMKRHLRGNTMELEWEKVPALIAAYEEARAVSEQATSEAIDLLDDVF